MTRRRLLFAVLLSGWLLAGHWAIASLLEPANLYAIVRAFSIC